jgi:hypothetical protein
MESTGLTFRGVGQECESEAMCTLCLEQDNHMVQTAWDLSGHGSRYNFRE